MKKSGVFVLAVVLALSIACYTGVTRAENESRSLTVVSPDGQYVGDVRNALVDPSGNILFVIVSLSGGMQRGDRDIIVPLSLFGIDNEKKVLVLDASKKDLSAAPGMDDPDLNDPAFAEKIYRFYGQTPPWMEHGMGKENAKEKDL